MGTILMKQNNFGLHLNPGSLNPISVICSETALNKGWRQTLPVAFLCTCCPNPDLTEGATQEAAAAGRTESSGVSRCGAPALASVTSRLASLSHRACLSQDLSLDANKGT